MKRCLFFLREIHRILLLSASYSTVCACVVSLAFTVLTINCGPPPTGQYHVPETANATPVKTLPGQSVNTKESLPETATIDLRKMPYVRNIFKQPLRIDRGGLDDFYGTTRGKVQHIAIISNISLDVLKAFIAKGWAPIVVVRLQGRSPEILPMSAYDNRSSEVILQNPINLGERRVGYKDFEMYGAASSRNKCVLITPQRLTELDVQKVLGRYLPTEAFQQVRVRSR